MLSNISVFMAALVLASSSSPATPFVASSTQLVRLADGSSLNAELDTMKVLENRQASHSREIPVSFLRLRSTAARPKEPIVYLSGGPGIAGSSDLQGPRGLMLARLREVADVIVLDQRGTGNSNTLPVCKPVEKVNPMQLTEQDITRSFHHQIAQCLGFWRAAGIDPRGYNLLESALDIEAVRTGIGAKQINLVTISYGSQLGMAYLKLFPRRVKKAVFASGRGLDQTVRLPSDIDAFLARVGGPDLPAMMRRVHARLDAHPQVATVSLSPGADPTTIRFDSFPVRFATSFIFMYDVAGVDHLYELYRKMDGGDFSTFAKIIVAFCLDPAQGRFDASRGMGELMDLSSNWSPARHRRWAEENPDSALGDAHGFPVPLGLGIDPSLDIPATLKEHLVSDLPALFLSGTHDGRVPLEAQAVNIKGFRNAKQIIVERGGHNIFDQSRQVQDAVLLFLLDGSVRSNRISDDPSTQSIPGDKIGKE